MDPDNDVKLLVSDVLSTLMIHAKPCLDGSDEGCPVGIPLGCLDGC